MNPRAFRLRYIVALVVVLWVLAFVLPNQTLDGFFLLASFPLIIWLLWRLVLVAVRRLRPPAARSQTWPYALENGTGSVALADFEAGAVLERPRSTPAASTSGRS